ncbi:MAG: tetratricopeptide repeat protein [Candidatus Eremiobacteraeota bacterium]|nr:tetratricopeptide repeat protein [Candidatus Eremiobacteraeota bacterium]
MESSKEAKIIPAALQWKSTLHPGKWKKGSLLFHQFKVESVSWGALFLEVTVLEEERGTRYVFKTFRPDFEWSEEVFDRLEHEGSRWAALESHGNILKAFGVVKTDPQSLLVREHFEGNDLTGWIGTPELDIRQALDFALQCADAMDQASRAGGLVHRDLKPGSLFITSGKVLKVTDFGLSRIFDGTEVPDSFRSEKSLSSYCYRLSKTGYWLGIPLYMAPEQEASRAHSHTLCDIFSFGMILYEMTAVPHRSLTKEWNEQMKGLYEIIRKKESSPDLFAGIDKIPRRIGEAVSRCLSRLPEDRYQSFADVRSDLASIYLEMAGHEYEPPPGVIGGNNGNDAIKAFITLTRGEYGSAMRSYNKALEADRTKPALWFWRGVALMLDGRYTDAVKSLLKSQKINPEMKYIYELAGNASTALGRYADALEFYSRVLSEQPDNLELWKKKGEALTLLGAHSDAICAFDEIIRRSPQNADAWKRKGISLRHLGRFDDALECFQKALEDNDDDSELWLNIALTAENLSKYDAALKYLERSIELSPRYADALNHRGLIMNRLSRYSEAIDCFNRALVSNQRLEKAWNGKGVALMAFRRHAEALNCFIMAVDINPLFAEAWTNKGNSLGSLGKFNEAMECFAKAAALDPLSAEAKRGMAVFGGTY